MEYVVVWRTRVHVDVNCKIVLEIRKGAWLRTEKERLANAQEKNPSATARELALAVVTRRASQVRSHLRSRSSSYLSSNIKLKKGKKGYHDASYRWVTKE